MQQVSIATPATGENGGPVFVMVPVDQWNDMVEKLKHYERVEELRRISQQMDNDPDSWVPWEQVKQGLVERGLVEASGAEA